MTTRERLIRKLYAGQCSRTELDMLLDLLLQDPGNDQEKVMEELWEQLHNCQELDEPAASEIIRRSFEKIDRISPKNRPRPITSGNGKFRAIYQRQRWSLTAAAAVLLLIAGICSWLWLGKEQAVVIQTAYAEQETIELPDRSIVQLNANSTLSFYKNWTGKKVRQVWLEGEAYFTVQKDQRHKQKFQVITKDLTVEVLGTVFNVNARQAATKVYLEEGKVKLDLEEKENGITMEPGEIVTYSRSSKIPEKKQVENEAPSSWKDGADLMTDATLEEVILRIEEIYGVTVQVRNPDHLNREFSIGIPVDKPDMGFLLLKELTGLKIQKNENRWIIE